jgi:hypothetical protein
MMNPVNSIDLPSVVPKAEPQTTDVADTVRCETFSFFAATSF